VSAQCRSCFAECFWAVTEKGKNVLVDVEPVSADVEPYRYTVDSANVLHRVKGSGEGYRLHFRSCPQADEWSGGHKR